MNNIPVIARASSLLLFMTLLLMQASSLIRAR